MTTYPSTKVRPYVYIGINPVTGQFYIGYREWNVKLNKFSHIDLFEYKTSSDSVKLMFDQMTWFILAEFKTGDDAYDFEQQLIFENWNDPLLLNESCYYGKMRFKAKKGQGKGVLKSEKAKKNMKIAAKNKPPRTKEASAKQAAKLRGRPQSETHIANRSAALLGLVRSKEHCTNLSIALKGKWSAKSKPITIEGITYSSFTKAATAYNMSTYKLKILIAGKEIKKPAKVIVNDITYESMSAAMLSLGLSKYKILKSLRI